MEIPGVEIPEEKSLADATRDEMSRSRETRLGIAPIWKIQMWPPLTIEVKKPPLRKMTTDAPQLIKP